MSNIQSIDDVLTAFERSAYETALAVCNGQIKRAAECLGIARTTLAMRLKRLGIDSEEYRDYLETDDVIELPYLSKSFQLPAGGMLRQKLLHAVFDELERNKWHRSKTAVRLGISRRCLTHYIRDLREIGYTVPNSK